MRTHILNTCLSAILLLALAEAPVYAGPFSNNSTLVRHTTWFVQGDTTLENLRAAINNTKSNIKNLSASLTSLDKSGKAVGENGKAAINTSHSNIKNLSLLLDNVVKSFDESQSGGKAAINNTKVISKT
ncbi:MAG: hypothetical protein ACT4OJ_14500 [Bacteroidota bacterium]